MPAAIKKLRFDDGESYWYPSVIQKEDEIVFPTGERCEEVAWCYGKMKDNILDPETIVAYDSYLEAARQMEGYSLGNI